MEYPDQQFLLAGASLAGGLVLAVIGWLVQRLHRQERWRQQLVRQLSTLDQRHRHLQQEHARLQAQSGERERQYRNQIGLLDEHRAQLRDEFENLAHRIFERRSEHFASRSEASMEALLKPFREQIGAFQQRIDRVHSESLKGQASLASELRRVLDIGLQMNEQAGNLATALKGDNKTAGGWGEVQLERSLQLAGLQAGEHYEAQTALRDEQGARWLPDFLIRLPDEKHIVIDSKVSLVDYGRAVAATSETTRRAALSAHAKSVRRHIDDLAGKNYTRLPQLSSPDFVLMFMAVEPAYIEALRYNPELFDYGYQRGVILVSHTTLMPVLRTVANLWIVERSNQEAREIATRAGDIYNQVSLLAERLHRLGNTLHSAGNQYNEAVRAVAGRQGLFGKIERFQQISTNATRSMPELDEIAGDLEHGRLRSAPVAASMEINDSPMDGDPSGPERAVQEQRLD